MSPDASGARADASQADGAHEANGAKGAHGAHGDLWPADLDGDAARNAGDPEALAAGYRRLDVPPHDGHAEARTRAAQRRARQAGQAGQAGQGGQAGYKGDRSDGLPQASPHAALLSLPWYASLHEFNLLPSRLMHASWHARFSPQDAIAALRIAFDDDAAVHRHWSAYILGLLGLEERPFLRAEAPELPVALLPADRFDQLVLLAGVTLGGPAIRHAIRRDEVAAWRSNLDEPTLRFARLRAAEFHPGVDWQADAGASGRNPAAQLAALGASAMLCAMRDAPDELFERLRLRLPMDTPLAVQEPLVGLSPEAALELMLRLTSEIDPQWLSYCTIH